MIWSVCPRSRRVMIDYSITHTYIAVIAHHLVFTSSRSFYKLYHSSRCYTRKSYKRMRMTIVDESEKLVRSFFSCCCRRLLLLLLRKINYLDVILSLAFSSMMLLPVIFYRKKNICSRMRQCNACVSNIELLDEWDYRSLFFIFFFFPLDWDADREKKKGI